MNRFLFPLILIIFVVFTVVTSVVKPRLYKPVKFDVTDIVVETDVNRALPSSELPIKPQSVRSDVQSMPTQVKPIKSKEQKPQVITKYVEVKPAVKPAPSTIEPQKTVPAPAKSVNMQNQPLTEKEEIIVWNAWRSRLQNQVMSDSNILAPYGTTFRFSFTVDRSGQISNLRVWAEPSTYTSDALRIIRPVIMSYEGRSILNFPARTKRTITNVKGGFMVSDREIYSTPHDFSDIEKVK